MAIYLAKRLLGACVVLWAIITITFGLMHAIPGGPFTQEKKLPPAVMATVEARYHLDEPLWPQYADYVRHAAVLDLGPSYKYPGKTVNDIIAETFPVSAQLGLISLLLAIGAGVLAGMAAAWYKNTWIDYAMMIAGCIGAQFYLGCGPHSALCLYVACPTGSFVEGAGLRHPAGSGSGGPADSFHHAPDPVEPARRLGTGLYPYSPVAGHRHAVSHLPPCLAQR